MSNITNLNRVTPKILQDMIKLKKKDLETLRENLKQIINLLDEYNIKYWIDFGTLLGIIRDNNFIPWDDDIDLGCLKKDGYKIYELEGKIKSLGWKYYIKYDQITIIKGITKIDIFFYSQSGDIIKNKMIQFKNKPILVLDSLLSKFHLYILTYNFKKRLSKKNKLIVKKISYFTPTKLHQLFKSSINNLWIKLIKKDIITTIPIKFVIPLKMTVFKDFKVSIPNQVEKYLVNLYGKDWTIPVIYNRPEIKDILNSLNSKLILMKK